MLMLTVPLEGLLALGACFYFGVPQFWTTAIVAVVVITDCAHVIARAMRGEA